MTVAGRNLKVDRGPDAKKVTVHDKEGRWVCTLQRDGSLFWYSLASRVSQRWSKWAEYYPEAKYTITMEG